MRLYVIIILMLLNVRNAYSQSNTFFKKNQIRDDFGICCPRALVLPNNTYKIFWQVTDSSGFESQVKASYDSLGTLFGKEPFYYKMGSINVTPDNGFVADWQIPASSGFGSIYIGKFNAKDSLIKQSKPTQASKYFFYGHLKVNDSLYLCNINGTDISTSGNHLALWNANSGDFIWFLQEKEILKLFALDTTFNTEELFCRLYDPYTSSLIITLTYPGEPKSFSLKMGLNKSNNGMDTFDVSSVPVFALTGKSMLFKEYVGLDTLLKSQVYNLTCKDRVSKKTIWSLPLQHSLDPCRWKVEKTPFLHTNGQLYLFEKHYDTCNNTGNFCKILQIDHTTGNINTAYSFFHNKLTAFASGTPFENVIPTTDGGFFLYGTYLLKTDSIGQVMNSDLGIYFPDSSALNITAFSSRSEICMYPNPSNEYISFSLKPNADNARLTIYNILGETVIKCSINSDEQIDISSLKPGIYFTQISVLGNNELFIGKLIKN